MRRPDGEWIRDEAADRAGPAGDWPAAPPGSQPETEKHWGHGGVPGFSVWVAAAVAVLAAATGVAAALLLISGTPAVSAYGAATPSASAPGVTVAPRSPARCMASPVSRPATRWPPRSPGRRHPRSPDRHRDPGPGAVTPQNSLAPEPDAGTVRIPSRGRPAADMRAFLIAASTRSGSHLIWLGVK